MKERKSKLNCWEFKQCGRQPQGHNVNSLGLCPASVNEVLDGTHDGVNAGRACWVIAGTLCEGIEQGTFAKKFKNCKECDFYNKVREEEHPGFELSIVLLVKLEDEMACVC
jgi:hypothetical protein